VIDLKMATLHDNLFIAGTNFQQTLDPAKRAGLKLQFDNKNDRLIVWFAGKSLAVKNWKTIEPIDAKDMGWEEPKAKVKLEQVAHAAQPNQRIQAQVSTPMGHVFANEPGLTGQAKLK